MGRRTNEPFRKPPQNLRRFYEEVSAAVQTAVDAFHMLKDIGHFCFDYLAGQTDLLHIQKELSDIKAYLTMIEMTLDDAWQLILRHGDYLQINPMVTDNTEPFFTEAAEDGWIIKDPYTVYNIEIPCLNPLFYAGLLSSDIYINTYAYTNIDTDTDRAIIKKPTHFQQETLPLIERIFQMVTMLNKALALMMGNIEASRQECDKILMNFLEHMVCFIFEKLSFLLIILGEKARSAPEQYAKLYRYYRLQ